MTASCNKVLLLGTLGAPGVSLTTTPHGQRATFLLVIDELGITPGQPATTCIPCEAWDTAALTVSRLSAGALVFFEGRLQRAYASEAGGLVVSGVVLTPLAEGRG